MLSAARIPEPPNRSNATVPSKPRPKLVTAESGPTQPEMPTVRERPSQPSVPAPRVEPAPAPVAPAPVAPVRRSKRPFVLIGAAGVIGTVAVVIALTKQPTATAEKKTEVIAVADASVVITPADVPSGKGAELPPDDGSATHPTVSDAGAGPVDATAPVIDAKPPKPTPPPPPPPNPEAAEALKDAEAALKRNALDEADRAARRALRHGNIARAYEILVEVSCANRDLPAVHGWLRNLPRSRWPTMHARCKQRGFTSTNP